MDQSVLKPATVTDIDKDAKVQPVTVANPAAAWTAYQEAQHSIDAASNPSYFSLPESKGGRKTALEIQIIQQNALTNLTVLTTMVGSMVKEIGSIVLNDVLRYQTVGEIGEIVNGVPSLLYKSYNIPKVKGGKSVTEKIVFTDAYSGQMMSDEEKDRAHVALLEEHGDNSYVWEVNPSIFINLNFDIIVEPDELFAKDSMSVAKMKNELYMEAIKNPLILNDPDKLSMVTRDFLFEPIIHGDAAKYLPDSTKKVLGGIVPGAEGALQGREGGMGNKNPNPASQMLTMAGAR